MPGIDGVGRGADGLLRYFILPDTTMGAMAEQTVIDPRRSIVLPEDSDPIAVAAAMNPAMSSWVALHQRVPFQAGQNVLVLGATGNAGRMAVQIARLLGADQVIAGGHGCWQRLCDTEPPVLTPISPLSLPESFDVLDAVWRLAFGKTKRLVSLTTITSPAALSLGCTTRLEFESRLSALADILDKLKVDKALIPQTLPADSVQGSLRSPAVAG